MKNLSNLNIVGTPSLVSTLTCPKHTAEPEPEPEPETEPEPEPETGSKTHQQMHLATWCVQRHKLRLLHIPTPLLLAAGTPTTPNGVGVHLFKGAYFSLSLFGLAFRFGL